MKSSKEKILVANRGEIAIRVIRAAKELGHQTLAIYSEADKEAAHVAEADEAACVGPAESSQSYLRTDKILEAAKKHSATAIHPGYGFLSEKAAFAEAVEKEGLTFIGPKAEHISQMGDKVTARETVARFGLPTVPGTSSLNSVKEAVEAVEKLLKERKDFCFPLLVKAAGGGGGKGMRRVNKASDLKEALERARSEAENAFQNPQLFVERFIEQPRHIEVQVFGDGKEALHFFERECSLQRRHQKVVEEALSPSITEETRKKMTELARKATADLGYRGAGTFEFIVSPQEDFYFLEMNTRIQVEHPVTEAVTQSDLVREQIRVAFGEKLSFTQEEIQAKGHAIELRLYAEDAENNYLPQPGRIQHLEFPHWNGVRVDSALQKAGEVQRYYDPMIAKLTAWGVDREQAIQRAYLALSQTRLENCITNQAFLMEILQSEFFKRGQYHTGILENSDWREKRKPSAKSIAALCLKDYLERAPRNSGSTLTAWQQTGGKF